MHLGKQNTKFGVGNYESVSLTEIDNSIDKEQVSKVVNGLGNTSLESIKESIRDINNLIISRQGLHKKMMQDMEQVEVDINNFMVNQQTEMPREELVLFKEKSIELSEAKRQEMLNCWRDISKLKEELRELKREINDKQSRISVLDSILGGNKP